jgi:hypothetical protein
MNSCNPKGWSFFLFCIKLILVESAVTLLTHKATTTARDTLISSERSEFLFLLAVNLEDEWLQNFTSCCLYKLFSLVLVKISLEFFPYFIKLRIVFLPRILCQYHHRVRGYTHLTTIFPSWNDLIPCIVGPQLLLQIYTRIYLPHGADSFLRS